MIRKRIGSVLLALGIMASAIPFSPVTAAEDTAVQLPSGNTDYYTRLMPEVMLLNISTANSRKFYEQYVVSADSEFNAINKFHTANKDWMWYTKDISDAGTYYWDDYDGSVVEQLSLIDGNLMFNTSATFTNYLHTHMKKMLGLITTEKQDILSAMGMNLTVNGSLVSWHSGVENNVDGKIRIGNQDYKNAYNLSGDGGASLTYTTSSVEFSFGTCTCGGTMVDNHSVAFYDKKAPAIKSVGGTITEDKYFVAGDKITVTVVFDEPVRFADDDAAAHTGENTPYVVLQLDGMSAEGSPKAMLTSFNNDTLTFTYTVSEDMGEKKISYLNFEGMFGDDIPLVHIGNGWTKTVEVPSDAGDSDGFTTSTCLITDLAGNAMAQKTAAVEAYLDTVYPAAAKILGTADTYNTDAKAAQGKTDPSAADYLDNSDLYLAPGDVLAYEIYMSEDLLFGGELAKRAQEYTGLRAKTNLVDKDGEPVYLSSFQVVRGEAESGHGLGASAGLAARFVMQLYTIDDGTKYANDGDTKIEITELEFIGGDVTDRCGNPALKIVIDEDAEDIIVNEADGTLTQSVSYPAYRLDATAPHVSAEVNGDGDIEPLSYTDNSMKLALNIGDTLVSENSTAGDIISDGDTRVSGVNSLNGWFIWKSDNGIPSYLFEYAVTASETTPDDSAFKTGKMNTMQTFTQVSGTMYLHLRPVDTESYEIYTSELVFGANDYAGNTISSETFTLIGVWDKANPSAKAGNVSRELVGAYGEMSVTVDLADKGGLDSAYYFWSDDTEPDEDDAGWTLLGGFSKGDKSAKVTPTVTVNDGDNYTGTLWIKVSDSEGNTAVVNLGEYSYNMTSLKYDLDYSAGITSTASLGVSTDSADGNIVFLIPADEADEYYLLTTTSATNIFDYSSNWLRVSYTEENGVYTFTYLELNTEPDYTWLNTVTGENSTPQTFSGTIPVTVISGLSGAFTYDGNGRAVTAGTDEYAVSTEGVSLRVSSAEDEAEDAFDLSGDILTTEADFSAVSDGTYQMGDPTIRNTLGGISFRMNLGEDKHGWNYEDIDWSNSELYMIARDVNGNKIADSAVSLQASPSQTITVPEGDYETGWWEFELRLTCTAGKDYVIPYSTPVFIDATPATTSDKIGITALDYGVYKNRSFNQINGKAASEYDVYGVDDIYQHVSDLDADTYYLSFNGEEDVIYFPAAYYSAAYIQFTPNGYGDLYQPYDSAETLTATQGETDVRIWNITAGETVDTSRSAERQYDTTRGRYSIVVAEKGDTCADNQFPLIANEANIIAMQVFNANGNVSEIVYKTIYPVAQQITGTVTATAHPDNGGNVISGGKLIFTPDAGTEALLAGAAVYTNIIDDNGENVQMSAQADGTYTCDLVDGSMMYAVHVIDAYGGYHFIGMEERIFDGERNVPNGTFHDYTIIDTDAPVLAVDYTGHSASTYRADFTINDETLLSKIGWSDNMEFTAYDPLPIELSFRFDDEYASRLANGKETVLTLTPDFGDVSSYVNRSWNWTADGVTDTGITYVGAEYVLDSANQSGYIKVTVEGVVKEDIGKANTDTIDFTLYMDVTDDFGHITTTAVDFTGLNNDTAFVDEFTYNTELNLTFSSPVKPAASWINSVPEYSTYHSSGFPITDDGTYVLEYYDVFGVLQHEELVLTDVFGDYGVTIELSTTELTKDPVNVTFTLNSPDSGRVMNVYRRSGSSFIELAKDVTEAGATETSNGQLLVMVYENAAANDTDWTNGHPINVYVTNIVDSAPTAELRFYFEQYGDSYSVDELPQGETNGYVQVWYTTDRYTTPTGGTASELTIRQGDADNYTFTFADSLGYEGSISFDLSELGVTIGEPREDTETPADTDAPIVTYIVSAKSGGVFTQSDTIGENASQSDIKEIFDYIFDSMGYVQAYSLTAKVLDSSDYKIVLLNEAPTALDYDTAVSDVIDGVTLTGNIITITKNVGFTVAVVDSEGNLKVTTFGADMTFDTTPPTVSVEIKQITPYSKKAYITVTDTDDNGNARTDGIRVISPVLEQDLDGAWVLEFTYNTSVEIIVSDGSGNLTKETVSVSDLDESSAVMTVTWTPPRVIRDSDGNTTELDLTMPTEEPVNKPVTAQVVSDKPIADVTAEYSTDSGTTWHTYTGSAAEPIEIQFTTDIIVVTFKRGCEVELSVTAQNRSVAVQNLSLPANIVDTEAPEVLQITEEPLTRGSLKIPYAVKLTITTSEPVRASGASDPSKMYNTVDNLNPLEVICAVNSTVMMTLTDEAGNTLLFRHTLKQIDNIPPVITLDPEDTFGMALTNGSAAVNVTVNEDCTLTCGEIVRDLTAGETTALTLDANGYYEVTVEDAAGNTSMAVISVGNIDNFIPSIEFDSRSVYVMQDTPSIEIAKMLSEGVNVWDNRDEAPAWTFDMSEVDPRNPGVYTVIYTVTDAAGNSDTELRYVKVQDKSRTCIVIDGIMTEEGGTVVLKAGEHKLSLVNLKETAPDISEPYTLKIKQGISTAGQLKYFGTAVPIAEDGTFTLNMPGFYTVYAITQSRQTCLTYVYIEN